MDRIIKTRGARFSAMTLAVETQPSQITLYYLGLVARSLFAGKTKRFSLWAPPKLTALASFDGYVLRQVTLIYGTTRH